MRVCGFCNGPGVNQEHVWPYWLRKVILESRAAGGMKHFHAEIERGGETKKFKSPKLEMKVGMPCESCNHGWMSGLENQVKTFMTQMVYRGDKTLLDPERQTHLMRWILKTAMVYEFTSAAAERKYFSDATPGVQGALRNSTKPLDLGRSIRRRSPNAFGSASGPEVFRFTTTDLLAHTVGEFSYRSGLRLP